MDGRGRTWTDVDGICRVKRDEGLAVRLATVGILAKLGCFYVCRCSMKLYRCVVANRTNIAFSAFGAFLVSVACEVGFGSGESFGVSEIYRKYYNLLKNELAKVIENCYFMCYNI